MGNPGDVQMIRLSYNDIHKAIQNAAVKINDEFGGGGFIPARILRTHLKRPIGESGKKSNIPIQAVGLVLYESMGGIEEKIGTEVKRTQWLDFSTLGDNFTHGGLLGRRILVVDEVDDTRTTLMYCLRELQHDIDKQLEAVPDVKERERLREETKLGVFVVHNKLKPKAGQLEESVKYFSAVDTPDMWLAYPWECDDDIDEHDAKRAENPKV